MQAPIEHSAAKRPTWSTRFTEWRWTVRLYCFDFLDLRLSRRFSGDRKQMLIETTQIQLNKKLKPKVRFQAARFITLPGFNQRPERNGRRAKEPRSSRCRSAVGTIGLFFTIVAGSV